MIEMIQILFPHMNPSDRAAFLIDISQVDSKKFFTTWEAIAPMMDEKERLELFQQLNIISN